MLVKKREDVTAKAKAEFAKATRGLDDELGALFDPPEPWGYRGRHRVRRQRARRVVWF